MDVGGVYHMAFLMYVNKLGALAEAGEQEEARLARAVAEEEQSDHFKKKEPSEEDLPPHVLAQDARLASYTTSSKLTFNVA